MGVCGAPVEVYGAVMWVCGALSGVSGAVKLHLETHLISYTTNRKTYSIGGIVPVNISV